MTVPLSRPIISVAAAIFAVFLATGAYAEDVIETVSTPPSSSPTTIYRQVMPDGRIVYSDKATKEGKVDHTITVEPPIQGNLWTTEPGPRPKLPLKSERTYIERAPSATPSERKKIAEKVTAHVIRAEMLLEDAKRRQEDGVAPLPGERTGNVDGTSRLNEKYHARQKLLAKGVAYAETNLKKALEEQDALR